MRTLRFELVRTFAVDNMHGTVRIADAHACRDFGAVVARRSAVRVVRISLVNNRKSWAMAVTVEALSRNLGH